MTSGDRYRFRHYWRSSLFAFLLIFLSAGSAHADTVCVLYFENNTGDTEYDVLGKGLADMFVTELSSVDELELVERSRLDDLLGELELQRGEAFDPETVQELGKVAGARYAVTGSFTRFEDTFRIDARMIEVENGKVVTASKVEGEKSDFFRLVSDLSGSFSEALGGHFDPDKSALGEGVDVETALAYSKAIDMADQGQLSEASAQLTKIVSGSSNFTLAKDRYKEYMRALYKARERREDLLGSKTEKLRATAEAYLEAHSPGDEDAPYYFLYRVLLGDMHLAAMKELQEASSKKSRPLEGSSTKSQDDSRSAMRQMKYTVLFGVRRFEIAGPVQLEYDLSIAKMVSPLDYAELIRLQKLYVHNTLTLIAESSDYLGNIGAFVFSRTTGNLLNRARPSAHAVAQLPEGDRETAKALGLGRKPGNWFAASPRTMSQALARFVILGMSPHFGEVSVRVDPSLAELDPSSIEPALALLDTFLEETSQGGGSEKEGDAVRVLDLHARCLFALGRTSEALMKWQEILDDYPTCDEYERVEIMMRSALGL